MNIIGLLSAVMKAAGINIDEKTRHELEVIIPQIPAKAQETVVVIDNAITLFDTRLVALENQCQAIQEQLHAISNRQIDGDRMLRSIDARPPVQLAPIQKGKK